jgi:hypothetical protein
MKKSRGNELYQLLLELAGLEDPKVEKELEELMEKLSMHPDTLSTDDMRVLMAAYLNEFQNKYFDDKPMIPDPFENTIGEKPSA